jgi:hypothetical protein
MSNNPGFKNLLDLEKLDCIKILKTESKGFGLKRATYSIGDTPFKIEIEFWKGDDFYSYNVKKIMFTKDSISVKANAHIEDGEWHMDDVLLMLPKEIQLEIIMNLDLFYNL